MKQSRGPSVGMFTVGIAALFLLGFLLLVIFGAQTYTNTVESQYGNNDTRSILSYLAAAVKSCDAEDYVYVQDRDGRQVLVLEDGSGYALRIFCEDGQLLEDYGRTGSDLQPEEAQIIGPTQAFDVRLDDGTLRIETDEGINILHLRSGRE